MKTTSHQGAVPGGRPGVPVVTGEIDAHIEIASAKPYLKLVALASGGHGPMAAEVPRCIPRPRALLSGDHVAHVDGVWPGVTRPRPSRSVSANSGERS